MANVNYLEEIGLNHYAVGDDLADRLTISDESRAERVVSKKIGLAITSASRWIDNFCGRHFYEERVSNIRRFEEVKYENLSRNLSNGVLDVRLRDYRSGVLRLHGPTDSTASVTLENNKDYWLLNDVDVVDHSHGNPPYTRLLVNNVREDVISGRTVQLSFSDSFWGFHHELRDSGEYAQSSNSPNPISALSRSIRLNGSNRGDIVLRAGHTIKMDEEQLFVRATGGGLMNVIRHVNGTPRSEQIDGTKIWVYVPPPPVAEACLDLAAYLYLASTGLRQLKALADPLGGTQIIVVDELRNPWQNVVRLLEPYRFTREFDTLEARAYFGVRS